MKKIVIIGGGVAGLAAGIYALKSGFSAEIIEKHAVVGGQCTGWKRQGMNIDNCIHWLTGTKPQTELYHIWETLGILGNGIEVIDTPSFFSSEHAGKTITLWKDTKRTQAEMLSLSPEDATVITDFFAIVKLCESMRVPSEKPFDLLNPLDFIKLGLSMADMGKVQKKLKGLTVADYALRFKHPLLQKMCTDYVPRQYSAYTFPVSYATYTSGNGGIPAHGSLAAAQRMRQRFESLGGTIKTGMQVKDIKLEGNRAHAVISADGSETVADYVVCACDPQAIFGTLLDKSYMDTNMADAYRNREAYPVSSGFHAAFALDGAYTDSESIVAFDCAELTAGTQNVCRMSTHRYGYDPFFTSGGKTVLQSQIQQNEKDYAFWQSISADKVCYDSEKQRIASDMLQRIETQFPQYRGKLSLIDTWSPLTYTRYLNSWRGSYMSFSITPKSKNGWFTGNVRALDNLVLAGQWLLSPGGLPSAAVTGKFAIQRILKKEHKNIRIGHL